VYHARGTKSGAAVRRGNSLKNLSSVTVYGYAWLQTNQKPKKQKKNTKTQDH